MFHPRGQGAQRTAVKRATHIEVEGQLIEFDAAAVARQRAGVGNDPGDGRIRIAIQVVGAAGTPFAAGQATERVEFPRVADGQPGVEEQKRTVVQR